MLKAHGLCKTYKIKEKKGFLKRNIKRKEAVRNIDMEIPKGKITGLLGANGAGKTTTIKMLASLISPDSGTVTMDGKDVFENNKEVKKHINIIVGGERNLYWRLTARENLEYFGSLYSIPKKEMRERIDRLLDSVSLEDVKDMPVEKFSKGMKQRLQIARGLINNPEYLFLDEPTLGLDVVSAKETRKYIRKIADSEGKGILLTTHYILEAEELCDFIYIINKGRIVAEGSADDIKNFYRKKFEYIFTIADFDKDLEERLEKAFCVRPEGSIVYNYDEENQKITVTSEKDVFVECMEKLISAGFSITDAKVKEPQLEDVLADIISCKTEVKPDKI